MCIGKIAVIVSCLDCGSGFVIVTAAGIKKIKNLCLDLVANLLLSAG